MANIPLKSIKFPDLDDTYTVPSNAGELPYNKSATYPADTVGKALQEKPDADGVYPDMTVGNAEQLVSNVFVEDKVPYQFRTAGGSVDIGKRAYFDAIVGGTVGWNQLIENGNFATDSLWSTSNASKSISNGICTITASAKNGYLVSYERKFPSTPNNHVYIGIVDIKLTTGTTNVVFRLNGGYGQAYTKNTTDWQTVTKVYKCANGDNGYYQVIDTRESGWDAIQVRNAMLIDLTVLLGSTIADYIYTLEQGQAGAGAAFFRKYFPNSYYPYSAGGLVSVSGLSAHKTTGFNQFDEEWEEGYYYDIADGEKKSGSSWKIPKNPIKVIGGASYYMYSSQTSSSSMGYACFYDADMNYLGQATAINMAQRQNVEPFSVPQNARYMTFYCSKSAYANASFCINLSWDGSRDGEYEEYKEHTYPLDDSLTLRGIPKLDASNKLYFDGDTYEPDGTVNRRYEERAYQGGDESLADAITDGTKTVVKKVTPTTEEAEAYNGIQIVDDFGTEEFVTTAIIPVGHVTHYPIDALAKLEMMPNSPSGNGEYIVTQSGGINEYTTLASSSIIENIINRLEALENA